METKERRIKLWVSLVVMALMLVYALFGHAGNLEPSGPPAPTMKTLDEAEPRIPISAADFPLTITEPNSYYLVEDVNFTDTVNHAITVDCNDVMIDLMGYTLKGPDSGNKSGVHMYGRSNVQIRNGTIRDFGGAGIYVSGGGVSSSHRVINIRALSNNGYGILLNGKGHLVKDCTVSANSGTGIFTGYDSTVTSNTCYNNGDAGIRAWFGCTVTGNTANNNGGDGIEVDSGCTVTSNTAWYNTDYGIYAWHHCLIDQNTAYDNTGGNLYTGTGCVLGTNCAP